MSFSSPRLYTGVPRLSRLAPSDTRPLQPQLQAGQASTRDVLKCALKTVDPKDYNVGFTPTEQAQLSSIFPNGICDYSQPGIGQQPLLGTYLLVQYGYVMPFLRRKRCASIRANLSTRISLQCPPTAITRRHFT